MLKQSPEIEILPYNNFDNVISKISILNSLSFTNHTKIKFQKQQSWEYTLSYCLDVCRILKTLELKYRDNEGKCNLIYKNKTLYNTNTISFKYDSANYTIKVYMGTVISYPGIKYVEYERKNIGLGFRFLEDDYQSLVRLMKSEYPRDRANELIDGLKLRAKTER